MGLLIKNGNIYDVKKNLYFEADILIEGKKITRIEKSIDANQNVTVINADGNKIFPGFIDAHSHIGMWTDREGGNDANECTNPITPQMRAIDGVNPFDPSFYKMKSAGITTVMITPGSGNIIAGQAAILKTGGKSLSKMLISGYSALKIAFGENPKSVYGPVNKSPSSRMAISAMIREEFNKAVSYYGKRNYNNSCIDPHFEVYIPVIEKKVPLKIHAHRKDDIHSAINICKEFNFRFTMDHFTEGHLIYDEIKCDDLQILLGPPFMFKTKQELLNGSIEGVKYLSDKNANISMTSDHPFSNARYLPVFLGLMVKNGLDYNNAIKMITLNPAKALGLEDSLGSIDISKDADLTILDGDPLELRTNVLMTIISGEIEYDIDGEENL